MRSSSSRADLGLGFSSPELLWDVQVSSRSENEPISCYDFSIALISQGKAMDTLKISEQILEIKRPVKQG